MKVLINTPCRIIASPLLLIFWNLSPFENESPIEATPVTNVPSPPAVVQSFPADVINHRTDYSSSIQVYPL